MISSSTTRSRIALSSQLSPLLSVCSLADAAAEAQLDGLDLDLTTQFRRWKVRDLIRSGGSLSFPVCSAWLSYRQVLSTNGSDQSLVEWLGTTPVRRVVVADDGHVLEVGATSDAFQAAIQLRNRASGGQRVLLGVRASSGDGGRKYLTQLRTLRRLAEEWDLGLAFDLIETIDWDWEAEAAVHHSGRTLDLIRVPFPPRMVDGHLRARMTTRTLAASIDTGFSGLYSVAPGIPIWQWTSRVATESQATAASDRIRAMIQRRRGTSVSSELERWTNH